MRCLLWMLVSVLAVINAAEPGPRLKGRDLRLDDETLKAASAQTPADRPVIKYKVLRELQDGSWMSVDAARTAFYSGDRVRFVLQSDVAGYAFLMNRGSSGKWNLIYPKWTDKTLPNSIPANKEQTMPPLGALKLDRTPGMEDIYILFSTSANVECQDLMDATFVHPNRPDEQPQLYASGKPRSAMVARDISFDATQTGENTGPGNLVKKIPASVDPQRNAIVLVISLRHEDRRE